MQYILSLLPILACPLGMGVMIFFLMRGNKQEQAPQRINQLPTSTYQEPAEVASDPPVGASLLNSIISCLKMCLNWKVLVGLAVVALGVLILAPQFIWAALPLLLVAACPLSMLVMMLSMHRGQSSAQPMQESYSQPEERTQEEQIARLQAQLASTQNQLETLTRETSQQEGGKMPTRGR